MNAKVTPPGHPVKKLLLDFAYKKIKGKIVERKWSCVNIGKPLINYKEKAKKKEYIETNYEGSELDDTWKRRN